MGDLLTTSDALGHGDTYTYDNLYRKITDTDADSQTTTYAYDGAGNMLTLEEADGNTTTWGYDNLDRAILETNQLGKSEHSTYNANGDLTSTTDRDGRVTTYSYDSLGRQTLENWLDGQGQIISATSFVYDDDGRLLSASDPAAEDTFTYDGLGQTLSDTQSVSGSAAPVALNAQYDAAGNRTQLAASIGGRANFVNQYGYDNAGQMTSVSQGGVAGGNAVAVKHVAFGYYANGQMECENRYASLTLTNAVAQTSFGYDADSRLTGIAHLSGQTTLASYTYTYDGGNRLATVDSLIDGTTTYSYDSAGQLTGATASKSSPAESYSYDSTGNRTNSGYTTPSNNELQSDGTYNYSYDDEGNRTKQTNIVTGAVTDFTWDYRNRLVAVTNRATDGGAATQVVQYAYDAFNRLVSRTFYADGNTSSPGQTQYFAYDGDQMILTLDSAGAPTGRILWGPAVDQILAEETLTSPGTPGSVLWPLTDNEGTVRDEVQYDAQAQATVVVNHLVYGAYGNLESPTGTLFAYTAHYTDPATGLQWNLNRWHDPKTGCWVSRDPIGFEGDPANLYRYCRNSPTASADPFGLAGAPPFGSPTGKRIGDALGGNMSNVSLEAMSQLVDNGYASKQFVGGFDNPGSIATVGVPQPDGSTATMQFQFVWPWFGGPHWEQVGQTNYVMSPRNVAGRTEIAENQRHVDCMEVRQITSMVQGTTFAALSLCTSALDFMGMLRQGAATGPVSAPARVPELPAFDGQTTHGVLITNEGEVIPFQSGNPSPTYANYPAASHVEGKAALAIRESGSSGGVVYHNNPSGTCGFCNSQVPTLLPEGAQLRVVPPAGTVPPGPRWYVPSEPYVGNSAISKPNPQLGR